MTREKIGSTETQCDQCRWFVDLTQIRGVERDLFQCANLIVNPQQEAWNAKRGCHCGQFSSVDNKR